MAQETQHIPIETMSREEIAAKVQEIVEAEVFNIIPELRATTAVLITGSVALGVYDKSSDVDVHFVFDAAQMEQYKDKIKQAKTAVRTHYPQIQAFMKDNFDELATLTDWQHDLKIKEFAYALSVADPTGQIRQLQEQLRWYPEEVFQEKVNWLFAETVFNIEDRLKASGEREDPFFTAVTKMQLLRLLLNTVFLLNRAYPVGDKQLYRIFNRLPNVPAGLKESVTQIIATNDTDQMTEQFNTARSIIEQELIGRGLIPKQDNKYWMDLRPKYQVEIQAAA